MTGGFGFPNYATQKKTPSSQAIGQALLQRGQMAQQGQPAQPAAPGSNDAATGFQSPGGATDAPDSALREQGAAKMTGAGQIDDAAQSDDGIHSANAVNVAVGEALTRMGGGYATNPNPYKPRDRTLQNLQQLGLSETEAMLLIRTGGA